MLEPGLLYFAYGCNMDPGILEGAIGRRAQKGRPACLDGWRLAFNVAEGADGWGLVASLVESEDCRTCGVVYRIPADVLRSLDEFENTPHLYRRATVWLQPLGRPARQAALTYIGQPERTVNEGLPRPGYATTLLDGARLHGLPADYIDWLRAKTRGETTECYAAHRG